MLPTSPDIFRRALNRLTFGARPADAAMANANGLDAWLNDQFAAPQGDDPALASFLASTFKALSEVDGLRLQVQIPLVLAVGI